MFDVACGSDRFTPERPPITSIGLSLADQWSPETDAAWPRPLHRLVVGGASVGGELTPAMPKSLLRTVRVSRRSERKNPGSFRVLLVPVLPKGGCAREGIFPGVGPLSSTERPAHPAKAALRQCRVLPVVCEHAPPTVATTSPPVDARKGTRGTDCAPPFHRVLLLATSVVS
jgi:hypothetical protein